MQSGKAQAQLRLGVAVLKRKMRICRETCFSNDGNDCKAATPDIMEGSGGL